MAQKKRPTKSLFTALSAHSASILLAGMIVALLLGIGYPSAAQSVPPGPIAPQPDAGAQPSQNIRVRVNLVNTPAVVRNSKGDLVLDLKQQNFRIFDNGVEQKIEGFDMGGTPVSVAIVVETSSRIAALLPAIQRTGILFTQTVLGDGGDAALIGYNDSVDTRAGFTSDHAAIETAFTHLTTGTSGTHLYDAMARAVQMLSGRPDSRRRVLITMAEAVDNGSENKLGQVLREAQLANITIYSIGLSTTVAELREKPRQQAQAPITPPGTFAGPPMPGTIQTPSTEAARTGGGVTTIDLTELAAYVVQHAADVVRERPLEVAAAATGGLYQSTFRETSIAPTIDQISAELHAQYTLTYRPTNPGPGDYHEIKVEVVGRRGVKVRSRPGYYLGPPQG